MADGKVAAVVLTDSYAWHETCNDPTTPRHDAVKGDKISVSQDEFERARAMVPPGLAKPGKSADVDDPES